MVVHVTRDELEHLEVYKEVGKLEAAVEQFQEEAEEIEGGEEAAFSVLVWIGKLLKEILK